MTASNQDTNAHIIPTRWLGCHFRSRLEARWAVFFSELGLKWNYEPEGYELPSGRYLPDFYIPAWDAFLEMKPLRFAGREPTREEFIECLDTMVRYFKLLDELRTVTRVSNAFIVFDPPNGPRGNPIWSCDGIVDEHGRKKHDFGIHFGISGPILDTNGFDVMQVKPESKVRKAYITAMEERFIYR